MINKDKPKLEKYVDFGGLLMHSVYREKIAYLIFLLGFLLPCVYIQAFCSQVIQNSKDTINENDKRRIHILLPFA